MKKAYVVGIDEYLNHPLSGCVNDANVVSELLSHNADGSPNFDVKKGINLKKKFELVNGIKDLFSNSDDVDTAIFYFSGHGMFDGDKGYLVLPDVYDTHDGLCLREVLDLANKCTIANKIIVLDCCHSGAISINNEVNLQPYVARGVTILSACREFESAVEKDGAGVFSSLFCEALRGGAAGVCGMVTPGNIYAFIDRSLGPWCQRPVFVSHVTSFVAVRICVPKVPLEIIRELPLLFPTDSFEFKLDPSFEDTNSPDIHHMLVKPFAEEGNVKIFKKLQKLQSVGLVKPVGEEFMYFAAMRSKSCKLTALGAHYLHLAKNNRI